MEDFEDAVTEFLGARVSYPPYVKAYHDVPAPGMCFGIDMALEG